MTPLGSMKLLCDGYYIPTTNAWGFLRCGLDEACEFYKNWNKNKPDIIRSQGTLRDIFSANGPNIDLGKDIFVSTKSDWVAVFENLGTQTNKVKYMSRHLKCQGLTITIQEHTINDKTGQYGGLQFIMYSYQSFNGQGTPDGNLQRVITFQYNDDDDDMLEFEQYGDVLPFEKTEKYNAQRIKDRFSQELLLEYCNALGLPVLDESFYGPDYAIFHSAYYDAKQTEQVSYDSYHHQRALNYGRK